MGSGQAARSSLLRLFAQPLELGSESRPECGLGFP
jgi:hypothetical protein